MPLRRIICAICSRQEGLAQSSPSIVLEDQRFEFGSPKTASHAVAGVIA